MRRALFCLLFVTLAAPDLALAAHAYVSNEDDGTVAVVALESLTVSGLVRVGKRPRGLVLSRDGARLYVAVSGMPKCPPPMTDAQCGQLPSEAEGSVSIIDARHNRLRRTVAVGKRPRDAVFSADSRTAFVPGEADASVFLVSLTTDNPATRVLTLPPPARPMSIALDAPRGRLYLSTGHGGSIAALGAGGDHLIGQVQVGGRPWGIALSADGERLLSADGPAGELAVLDAPALTVIGKVAVGHGPWGVVLGP